jgi:DNA-binding transcriptional MerR regulator
MDGYSISQVAERTGFTTSTLRFYEQAGLVRPDRAANGYRTYDEHHVELLSFIGRAKGFGLSLDEITDLLPLLDGDECAPVQGRLHGLVEAKIADAQRRIADLIGFTSELRRVSATLARHTPAGPCDDSCGCTTDPPATSPAAASSIAGGTIAVPLVEKRSREGSTPIACTLPADRIDTRIVEWQERLSQTVDRRSIDGGVRLWFAPDVDVAELAALAAAEQRCCPFFTFGLTIGEEGVALDVTGPPDAQPVIEALVGAS